MSAGTWRKASRCTADANCVEVAQWRTASRCSNEANCVEVGAAGSAVAVRDSTDPDGPMLVLSPAAWAALLTRTKEECRVRP